MSRGLQMPVEEGSIPHALMLCGPSGSKTCHRFCRNRRREPKPSTVFAEIGVGSQNRPPFLQK